MKDHSHKLAPDDFIRLKVKAELRKRLRGVRKTTPLEACAERSRALIERLETHPDMLRAKSVALFWPIVSKHEVDLRELDTRLRARGVRIAYPAIDADTNVMTMRFVDDANALVEKGFGFMEPAEGAPEALALDLLVVPAIAVDPTGHRIGYGAGYYDRTLPRYAPPAVTIVVAFDWQLVAEVPAMETDVRCQWVLTDVRSFDASS